MQNQYFNLLIFRFFLRMSVGHDGSGTAASCENNKNIMASTLPSGPGSMKWSACSRERFQDFLRYFSHQRIWIKDFDDYARPV